MATVYVGSARMDENGNTHGGKAGDQTGKEVSTQAWYKHAKGWRVLRCKDAAKAAKIAQAMKAACANEKIGYDQYERDTLYNLAKNVGFDPAKVTKACETDCSALVRVCCAYAGIRIDNFRTTDQASKMLQTGAFVEMADTKYTTKPDYLRIGDVLVTRTQGHTVVVLNDGAQAEYGVPAATAGALGERLLKKGCIGSDVEALQLNLITLGYACGRCGADGEFGGDTEAAVKAFQQANGLEVDGEYGEKSHAAMLNKLGASAKKKVRIAGGQCWVRTAPNTCAMQLGVAKEGATYDYNGEASADGWISIRYQGQPAWVSAKYGKVEENA